MVTYVVLCSFTHQGMRNIRTSPERVEAFQAPARKYDVVVHYVLWTQGRWDMIIIADAPDEYAASALDLSMCAMGNVRTETMRAFTIQEMGEIVSRMQPHPNGNNPHASPT